MSEPEKSKVTGGDAYGHEERIPLEEWTAMETSSECLADLVACFQHTMMTSAFMTSGELTAADINVLDAEIDSNEKLLGVLQCGILSHGQFLDMANTLQEAVFGLMEKYGLKELRRETPIKTEDDLSSLHVLEYEKVTVCPGDGPEETYYIPKVTGRSAELTRNGRVLSRGEAVADEEHGVSAPNTPSPEVDVQIEEVCSTITCTKEGKTPEGGRADNEEYGLTTSTTPTCELEEPFEEECSGSTMTDAVITPTAVEEGKEEAAGDGEAPVCKEVVKLASLHLATTRTPSNPRKRALSTEGKEERKRTCHTPAFPPDLGIASSSGFHEMDSCTQEKHHSTSEVHNEEGKKRKVPRSHSPIEDEEGAISNSERSARPGKDTVGGKQSASKAMAVGSNSKLPHDETPPVHVHKPVKEVAVKRTVPSKRHLRTPTGKLDAIGKLIFKFVLKDEKGKPLRKPPLCTLDNTHEAVVEFANFMMWVYELNCSMYELTADKPPYYNGPSNDWSTTVCNFLYDEGFTRSLAKRSVPNTYPSWKLASHPVPGVLLEEQVVFPRILKNGWLALDKLPSEKKVKINLGQDKPMNVECVLLGSMEAMCGKTCGLFMRIDDLQDLISRIRIYCQTMLSRVHGNQGSRKKKNWKVPDGRGIFYNALVRAIFPADSSAALNTTPMVASNRGSESNEFISFREDITFLHFPLKNEDNKRRDTQAFFPKLMKSLMEDEAAQFLETNEEHASMSLEEVIHIATKDEKCFDADGKQVLSDFKKWVLNSVEVHKKTVVGRYMENCGLLDDEFSKFDAWHTDVYKKRSNKWGNLFDARACFEKVANTKAVEDVAQQQVDTILAKDVKMLECPKEIINVLDNKIEPYKTKLYEELQALQEVGSLLLPENTVVRVNFNGKLKFIECSGFKVTCRYPDNIVALSLPGRKDTLEHFTAFVINNMYYAEGSREIHVKGRRFLTVDAAQKKWWTERSEFIMTSALMSEERKQQRPTHPRDENNILLPWLSTLRDANRRQIFEEAVNEKDWKKRCKINYINVDANNDSFGHLFRPSDKSCILDLSKKEFNHNIFQCQDWDPTKTEYCGFSMTADGTSIRELGEEEQIPALVCVTILDGGEELSKYDFLRDATEKHKLLTLWNDKPMLRNHVFGTKCCVPINWISADAKYVLWPCNDALTTNPVTGKDELWRSIKRDSERKLSAFPIGDVNQMMEYRVGNIWCSGRIGVFPGNNYEDSGRPKRHLPQRPIDVASTSSSEAANDSEDVSTPATKIYKSNSDCHVQVEPNRVVLSEKEYIRCPSSSFNLDNTTPSSNNTLVESSDDIILEELRSSSSDNIVQDLESLPGSSFCDGIATPDLNNGATDDNGLITRAEFIPFANKMTKNFEALSAQYDVLHNLLRQVLDNNHKQQSQCNNLPQPLIMSATAHGPTRKVVLHAKLQKLIPVKTRKELVDIDAVLMDEEIRQNLILWMECHRRMGFKSSQAVPFFLKHFMYQRLTTQIYCVNIPTQISKLKRTTANAINTLAERDNQEWEEEQDDSTTLDFDAFPLNLQHRVQQYSLKIPLNKLPGLFPVLEQLAVVPAGNVQNKIFKTRVIINTAVRNVRHAERNMRNSKREKAGEIDGWPKEYSTNLRECKAVFDAAPLHSELEPTLMEWYARTNDQLDLNKLAVEITRNDE
ncbi:unnamed protein product [Notodromas monacha]|uniref:Uncharacterized protein n=1 Tax=Notodromas monacha TaxID=399045 RepID=A0A7R9BJD3_9CRUS|nr:unnamed protein product [Notodromas monacha]CAG0916553.1 unnamed protein product [Notodromas monacha]